MSDYQIKERWVTGDSVSKLTSILGLRPRPGMQDWERECADAGRLGEFLGLYERGGLNDDDRFALMALIVSSFDDWLRDGGVDQAISERVRQHLLADFRFHEWTIHYWCLWDESEADNVFHATPFMREVWRQQRLGPDVGGPHRS